jgi:hypothetical protein
VSVRHILVLGAAFALACSRAQPPIETCEPLKNARPVCGFHNPEDFALLEQSHALVVSEMGSPDGSRPGALVLFDLERETTTPLFPAPGSAPEAARPGWGDPTCPGAPDARAFAPHGLDLAARPDGARELLVVNHGGRGERDAVELFEVVESPPAAPRLAFRGCALAPDDSLLNDVAALPDGGFVATNSLPKRHPAVYLVLGLLRVPTGDVLEWQPGAGFRELPGTRAAFPNGIAVSKDGETLWVDEYLDDEVRKISRKTGALLASVDVPSPDNLNWTPSGKLLVASHNAPLNEIAACARLEKGQCPFWFAIQMLDPVRMDPPITFYDNSGPPLGGGTSALQVGGELVIGSFAGDRLLRVTLPEWQKQLLAAP